MFIFMEKYSGYFFFRYQSILKLRQPMEKDNGKYTITATTGSHAAQFSFDLRVKGNHLTHLYICFTLDKSLVLCTAFCLFSQLLPQ